MIFLNINEIKQGSVYTLADCGIFAALGIVLVLVSTYIPLLGFLAALVWSVPVIIVVLRRGVGAGILTSVVVFMLSVLFTGPVMGVVSGITVGVFGIAYGICFKKKISPGKTLFIGTIVAGLVTVITLTASMFIGNIPINSLIQSAEDSFREIFATYDEMGLLAQVLPAGVSSNEYIAEVIDMFRRLLPGVFILAAMSMAALNYVFAALILKKFQFDIRPLPLFREWHFPWWIMWGIAVVLAAYLMGKQLGGENYFLIAQNILYIYLPIFMVSGVSIITYFFHMWKLSNGIRGIIWVIAVLFMSFSLPFIILMGAIDTVLDYRKHLQKITNELNKKVE